MRRWWIGGLPAAALVIAGCGGVSIAPEPVLPKALVVAIPAKVGFVVAGEQRTYSHNEERGGVPWERYARAAQTVVEAIDDAAGTSTARAADELRARMEHVEARLWGRAVSS